MARARYVVSNDEAQDRIKELKQFRNQTGALRATPGGASEYGYLPTGYHEQVRDAEYVVYSYRTPIAWVTADGDRIIPDVGYSPTTGQHQYIVKGAWREDGWRSSTEFPARRRTVVKVPKEDDLHGEPRRLRRGGLDEPYGYPEPGNHGVRGQG
jgi:hypothetical protein